MKRTVIFCFVLWSCIFYWCSASDDELLEQHLNFKWDETDVLNFTTFNFEKYLERWVYQKIDHFNLTDNRKWKQRYFAHSLYHQNSGPVFLLIGGPYQVSLDYLAPEFFKWAEYAKEFNAMCLILEHRYYGKSRPTEDTSVENLKYLAVDQALADIKSFIMKMKSWYNISDLSKWVLFGHHYSGSLAIWTRMNQPQLVHAVVASSGIMALRTDYHQFFEIVQESLEEHSSGCTIKIKSALRVLNLLLNSDFGVSTVSKKMMLCNTLDRTSNQDRSLFYVTLFDIIAKVVLDNDFSEFNIKYICGLLTTIGRNKEKIDELSEIVSEYSVRNNLTCSDTNHTNLIESLKSTSWEAIAVQYGKRQQWFQKCTELGLFETASNITKLFGYGIPLNYYEDSCTGTFGSSYNFINLEKWQKKINELYVKSNESRIINVLGSINPYHAVGILKDSNDYVNTVFIKGTSNIGDVLSNVQQHTNSTELQDAHKKIKNFLAKWLKNND